MPYFYGELTEGKPCAPNRLVRKGAAAPLWNVSVTMAVNYRGEWNPNLTYDIRSGVPDEVYWMGQLWTSTYNTTDSNPYYKTGWAQVGTATVRTDPAVPTWYQSSGGASASNPSLANLAVSASTDHSITLTWDAALVPGSGEVSSYNILVNGTQVGTTTGTGTSYTIGNLSAATSYTVSVVAVDAYGSSGTASVPSKGSPPIELNVNPGANPTLAVMTSGAHTSNGKYFSPYIDVGLPNYDLYNVAKASGISNFTLAFQNSSYANLDPTSYSTGTNMAAPALKAGLAPSISFGGLAAVNTPTGALIDEINQIQHALGGTVTLSIGGYTGIDPAVIAREYVANLQASGMSNAAAMAKAASTLQGEFQSAMNTFGVTHLDFDIETEQSYTYTDSTGTHFTNDPTQYANAVTHQYTVTNDTVANALRNTAIVALEAANPGMGVTFTVAASASAGLSSNVNAYGGDVYDMINTALQAGVKIDAVNLMVMDFDTTDVGASGDSSQAGKAIDAALKVHAQFPNLKIALTPMIGQNDGNSGLTSLADAARIAAFAQANSWVVGTGEWQLGRDQAVKAGGVQPGSTTAVQTYQSGVNQTDWQFSSILSGAGGDNKASIYSDHNGDGTSDILLQNGGTVVNWTMQNGLYSSGSTLTTGATGYTVVGKGDFNADGVTDVLLQNGGTVVQWTMMNGAYQSGSVLTTGAAGYSVVGVGDFNKDGTSDVLLQNGGTVVEWFMKNGAYQSGATVTTGAGAFKVVGVGDFNGDGTSDVLLQNGTTVVEWFMQNGAVTSTTSLTAPAGYKVVGVGDFNGDGTSDILLQNGGTVVDWMMQNGAVQSTNTVATGATGFTVVATGDYNGDGVSDVLLQNGGTVVDWIMLAGQYQTGHVITSGATGFTVV